MKEQIKETSVFPLEMFAKYEIKPMLNVPSGYFRAGGGVCDDGRGMLCISISENYAEPLTRPVEPADQVKEVLLMLIPTIERADCLIETLWKIRDQMRGWQAGHNRCRAGCDNGATQDTEECRVSDDNAET